MAAAKNHDYHIIDPSPWPIIASFSALAAAVGFIFWMRDLSWAPWMFGLGVAGVFYTMYAWWSDVVQEAETGHHTPVVQLHHRYGVILFIAYETMFFVAWFWAFFNFALFPEGYEAIETATGGVWPPKDIELLDPFLYPLLNTLILLLSGTTLTWAHHSLIEGDRQGLKNGLLCTVVLGVIFSLVQVYEYAHAAFAFSGHVYGATFYMATGFHGFHVFIGTIFLIVCLLRANAGHFKPNHHFGFEAAAWYWHFVDVVWLFLFLSMYVWGSDFGAAVIGH